MHSNRPQDPEGSFTGNSEGSLHQPDYQALVKVIAARDPRYEHPPEGGFADLMARAVLSARPAAGNFPEVLEGLIESRILAALHDQDHEVVATLMEFHQVRLPGKRSSHRRGKTYTRVSDTGATAPLHRKIESGIFGNRRIEEAAQPATEGEGEWQVDYPLAPPDSSESAHSWRYRITRSADGRVFTLHHAANEEVPALVAHLNRLWGRCLGGESCTSTCQDLAAFEWLFLVANITGRCSAALGDALSLILHMQMGLDLRQGFIHLDWEALSRDPASYLQWRLVDLRKRADGPNPSPRA